MEAQFPKALEFLFKPARYKVAYGGRGSGKSWGFARALLIQGAAEPLRVLCAREFQNSISESVHQLLADQIGHLGLDGFYEIQNACIRGANGTEFIFAGLRHNVNKLKSLEGVDRVFCEESQNISKDSWDTLIPTIRKPGSEIWVCFNPELDSDETFKRFVTEPPEDAIVQKVNWSENPWFPEVLLKEKESCRIRDPEGYETIWEGKPRSAVRGAIYANEIVAAQTSKRIGNVPYDPLLKVHVVYDLGWNDSMSIALVQKTSSEIRVIEYIEDNLRTLDSYSAQIREKRLNWGTVWLPHDGKAKNIQTGKSAFEVMQALGWEVQQTPDVGVETGIRTARMTFPRIYFDKPKTGRLIECLKRYKRRINQQTGEPGEPLHDEYSHGADCFRYLCVAADSMVNETWGGGKVLRRNIAGIV